MSRLKDFFIPSERNGYAPSGLEKRAILIMLGLVLFTFVSTNAQRLLLIHSETMISAVLPAALVDLTNEQREDDGLSPLARNSLLDDAAKMKAENMATEGYFAHESPDGITPWYWFDRAGYKYMYAGENLAVLFTDSSEVVEAWMGSMGHRANIMNEKYEEIGIGLAKGTYKGEQTVFIVQMFGTERAEARATAASTRYKTMVEDNSPVTVSNERVERGSVLSATTAPSANNPRAGEFVPADIAGDLARVITQPNAFITYTYVTLAAFVVLLLMLSIGIEWRHQHPLQVAYGFGLIGIMLLILHFHFLASPGVVIV